MVHRFNVATIADIHIFAYASDLPTVGGIHCNVGLPPTGLRRYYMISFFKLNGCCATK